MLDEPTARELELVTEVERLREVEAAVREHLNNCIAGPRLRRALEGEQR